MDISPKKHSDDSDSDVILLTIKQEKTTKPEPAADVFAPERPKLSTTKPVTAPGIVKQEKAIKTEPIIDLCSPEQPTRQSFNPVKHENASERSVEPSPGIVRVGSIYKTLDDAKNAIFAREERLGYNWKTAQSAKDAHGNLKKTTFRCNHYSTHKPAHSVDIDPSDHRTGKSMKTDCMAHVNVNRVRGSSHLWSITLVEWDHNHPRPIPEGAPIRRPPTKEQKDAISRLATSSSSRFSRGQLADILKTQTGSTLEPRQIGNIMNKARLEAREEVGRLGGDIHAI
ncbi:hypothetical protein BDZ97DRAFT_1671718, partial [Flammula alnicola]